MRRLQRMFWFLFGRVLRRKNPSGPDVAEAVWQFLKGLRNPGPHVVLGSWALRFQLGTFSRIPRDVDLYVHNLGKENEVRRRYNGVDVHACSRVPVGFDGDAGTVWELLRYADTFHGGLRVACLRDATFHKECLGRDKDWQDLAYVRDELELQKSF